VRTITRPEELKRTLDDIRARGSRVGFVPTMGALHDGHLALVRDARERAEVVVASIFVNPTQFGPKEDFSVYPRDLAGDAAKLESAGAELLFAPETAGMYLSGDATRVRVGLLTDTLCGPFRPGHFEGVTTVVAKLFGLVGPCIGVFGKKDYQQLAVLRRMVADLFLPVEIVGHPLVREVDGLAMSSRNAYLSAADRVRALGLVKGLRAGYTLFDAGERDAATLERAVRAEVQASADTIDYVSVADADSLQPVEFTGERALIAIACRVGGTRLIDNVVLGEDPRASLR
jgi:pantoate--beta-alanine ligase